MKSRRYILFAALGALVLTAASAVIFQDNLVRWMIKPRTPFQAMSPPPPPEYGARGAWILWPDNDDGPADIFYVHSTTYYSNKSWNAAINDAKADEALRKIAAPNEAGPFLKAGAIYGPRYRQATLYARFTRRYDGSAARRLAYGDVRRAFETFLKTIGDQRPIVLVGYGQGGLIVQGLLQEFFENDESLRKRLAVAYVIDQATPMSLFSTTLKNIPPCLKPSDIRCVVSYADYEPRFDEERERVRHRSMVWSPDFDLVASDTTDLLCVNPLTWTATTDYVSADENMGAASATGLRFGETPAPVTHAVGAECLKGVLRVDRPVQGYLRRGDWFGAKWRAQPFNLFYFDLADDVERRLQTLAARRAFEYRHLAPIDNEVDLKDSPINKVPE
ncbi:MAG: DUF3089 domain-containing protein [Alphaproteobacteria bacterium]|nr:DUF3089 domain-containing protein [Alphaproteobacteria bacterium]